MKQSQWNLTGCHRYCANCVGTSQRHQRLIRHKHPKRIRQIASFAYHICNQFRGFEISPDFTMRRPIRYWNMALINLQTLNSKKLLLFPVSAMKPSSPDFGVHVWQIYVTWSLGSSLRVWISMSLIYIHRSFSFENVRYWHIKEAHICIYELSHAM